MASRVEQSQVSWPSYFIDLDKRCDNAPVVSIVSNLVVLVAKVCDAGLQRIFTYSNDWKRLALHLRSKTVKQCFGSMSIFGKSKTIDGAEKSTGTTNLAGLNVLGKCITPKCKNEGTTVAAPRGFGKFSLHEVYSNASCPDCKGDLALENTVEQVSDNVQFINCRGTYRGRSTTEDTEAGFIVGGEPHTLGSLVGNKTWKWLEIVVEKRDET